MVVFGNNMGHNILMCDSSYITYDAAWTTSYMKEKFDCQHTLIQVISNTLSLVLIREAESLRQGHSRESDREREVMSCTDRSRSCSTDGE